MNYVWFIQFMLYTLVKLISIYQTGSRPLRLR